MKKQKFYSLDEIRKAFNKTGTWIDVIAQKDSGRCYVKTSLFLVEYAKIAKALRKGGKK